MLLCNIHSLFVHSYNNNYKGRPYIYGQPLHLQFLVNAFGLAISLQVIGCRKCLANAKKSVQFTHEFGNDLGATVRQGGLGHPMVLPYLTQEEVHSAFSCDSSVCWNEVRTLAQ